MRVPLAASGCPMAIAPPCTLVLARSSPSSRSTARYCGANASFTSTRSICSSFIPAFCSALRAAGAGPIPMYPGSTPTTAHATSRPCGFRPCDFAKASLATIVAAAPSAIPEALPAVTRPSFLKYGLRESRTSRVVSGRMCSSARNSAAWPFLFLTGTAITSSTSLRVSLYRSARCSAVSAIERPHCGSLRASHSRSSSGAGPSRRPQRAPRTTCGAWLIDSAPPASTAPASPSRISCAACAIASNPEPHSRLTVTAGTSMGSPALSPTWRAR